MIKYLPYDAIYPRELVKKGSVIYFFRIFYTYLPRITLHIFGITCMYFILTFCEKEKIVFVKIV